jgi:hypothetical protein
VATIQHSMKDVITQLDAKIAELEGYITKVSTKNQAAKTAKNDTALKQMNDSLAAAKRAKTALMDSCCIAQICNYDADI